MTIPVEPERERGFALAAECNLPERSAAGRRSRNGRGNDEPRNGLFLSLEGLNNLVDLVLFDIVAAVQAVDDLGPLIVHGRMDRREPGRMRARMFDDVVTERIVIYVAVHLDGLRRFEPHIVPAEVLKAIADLAEALRPHGRASGALASEKAGGKGGERLGFGSHLDFPH